MTDMARDAIAFLDALRLTEVDLLGYSLGGMIAQEIALLRPRVVRRIVLAGTAPPRWRPSDARLDRRHRADRERREQPTLVANGDNDRMIPTVNSQILADHIPNARLRIFPDAAHGFLFQYPTEFAQLVNRFLDT